LSLILAQLERYQNILTC